MPRGVVVKAGTLNVNRHNCWILVGRNQRPGPGHGEWQPLSVMGFTVVFASKLDAMEFRLLYGSSQFPVQGPINDDAYEAYIEQFIKLRPYELTGRYEVWGHNVRKGWVPRPDEILSGKSDSQYDEALGKALQRSLVEQALRSTFTGPRS